MSASCENHSLGHDESGLLLPNCYLSRFAPEPYTKWRANGEGSFDVAQDPELSERMRAALGTGAEFTEKQMMGGTCFFLNGNMVGGADRSKDGERRFMFRVGKDNVERAAELGAMGQLLLGDRVMPGFYFVDAKRCDDVLLGKWLALALENARSLPPK